MTKPTFQTEPVTPPGLATGAAYQDLDALGQVFSFVVPPSGIIQSALYYDLDDEGLQVDLLLFRDSPVQQVDNAAVALVDTEVLKAFGRIQFTAFADLATGQFANVNNLGLAYAANGGRIWAIAQARGALNIAANNLPSFRLVILPD
jgi:hypothetical protein